MGYELDKRLQDLSHLIRIIDDIEIRLADDSRYLWIYLVPQREDVSELDDLDPNMRERLLSLATDLSTRLKTYSQADKMNIAMIGNIVSQFHLHIVARHHNDEAWPDPIWGRGTMQPYDNTESTRIVTALRGLMDAHK